jgi:hypothetical protein
MPLELVNRPVRFNLTFEDRDKNKSRSQIQFPSTVTIADLAANLATIEGLFAALSNAYIVDGTISIDLRQTTVPTEPAPEASDVERKGVFTFATTVENSFAKIEIPSVANEFVVDGTNRLNLLSPTVAAFVAFMIEGLPGNLTGEPVNGPGNSITKLLTAKKIHRGSGKG